MTGQKRTKICSSTGQADSSQAQVMRMYAIQTCRKEKRYNSKPFKPTFFSSSSSSFHLAPRSLPTSPTRSQKPSAHVRDTRTREKDQPKLASGFSCLILSRQSWLKNMYAERARLGALGSFLRAPPRVVFSGFSAALRVCEKPTLASMSQTQGMRVGMRGGKDHPVHLGLGSFLGHLGHEG